MRTHSVSSASTRKNFGLDVEFRPFSFPQLHVGRAETSAKGLPRDAREIRRRQGFNWGLSEGEALLDNKEVRWKMLKFGASWMGEEGSLNDFLPGTRYLKSCYEEC